MKSTLMAWAALLFLWNVAAENVDALSFSSEDIAVAIDAASGAISITDSRTGETWRSQPPAEGLEVTAVDAEGENAAVIALRDERIGRDFTGKVSLEDDAVTFTLAGDEDAPLEASAARFWPLAFAAELDDGRMCFSDRSCGVLIKTSDETYGGRTLRVYGNVQCLDMPWVGVMDGLRGGGMVYHIDTPFDADVVLQEAEAGLHWPQIKWLAALQKLAYPRSITLHFVPDGGYVAMAKQYRKLAEAKGLVKTLREKAEAIPAVQRLAGAPIVWGDQNAEEFVRQARDLAGMQRAVLGNAHVKLEGDDALRRLNEMGYLTSEYDSIGDILEGPTAFQRDDVEATAYHWLPDAGPAKGWLTLEGLQYYFRSSAKALDALKQYVPPRLERYGFNARFMDVAGAVTLFEDYHPEHTFDRRQDLRYRVETYAYFREFGLVIGTEHGNDWCMPWADYFEGSTSGPFWWATDDRREDAWNAGHLRVPTDRSQLPKEYLDYGMGMGVRIPLWDLVYHDCAAGTWYWGDTAGFMYKVAPDIAKQKDLYNLLYGTLPLLWRDSKRGYDWFSDEGRARFIESYQNTCRFQESVLFDELVEHAFVTPDGQVQRSRFSSGAEVVVNLSDSEAECDWQGETVTLAPYGFMAQAEGVEQSRRMVDGVAITRIAREGFLRVETEQDAAVGPVSGSGSITCFEADGGAWHCTLEGGSKFKLDVAQLPGWDADAVAVEKLDVDAGTTSPVEAGREGSKLALKADGGLTVFRLQQTEQAGNNS